MVGYIEETLGLNRQRFCREGRGGGGGLVGDASLCTQHSSSLSGFWMWVLRTGIGLWMRSMMMMMRMRMNLMCKGACRVRIMVTPEWMIASVALKWVLGDGEPDPVQTSSLSRSG